MDFSQMSKKELIDYINNLNEQNNGKYGLVWDKEKEPEKIVVECDKKIPILKEIKKKAINNGGHNNILIEGDNFHALSVLNYTHKESIDVIYIDPPYNTGKKDFIYNDKYIDEDDGYRHSKWLNFMDKRLKLARNLLSEDGIIFISIDDNELSQLKLMCDRIFGSQNLISCMPRKTTEHIRVTAKYEMQNLNDYVLVYALDKMNYELNKKCLGEKEYKYQDAFGKYLLKPFQNSGEAGTREARPNLYYPIYYDEKNEELYLDKHKGCLEILPKKVKSKDGRWLWSREKFLKDKKLLEYKNGTLYRKEYQNGEDDNNKYESEKNWLDSFPNRLGANALKKIGLEELFTYSKPPELVMWLINLCKNKDAIVLDFFAGSGTTGHAVLELNSKDGGNRKFILCTNNENSICEDVTYPRIKTVITGKRVDKSKYSDGLAGSLQYFKTDFVDNIGTKDQLYYDLTEKCIPMLCVKGDTFIPYKSTEEYTIFTNDDKSMYSCVYFDVLGQKYKEFLKEVKKIKEPKLLYIFNLGDYIDLSDLKEIDNYSVESIPYKIIELYKKIVKMSKGE